MLTLLILKGQDEVVIIVLSRQPIKAINGQRIMVNPTYVKAKLLCCSSNIRIVSTEKVDIVVKPPSNPVPRSSTTF